MHIRRARLLYRSSFDAASLGVVRRRVLRQLHLAGLSGRRADGFLIAVAEILANAVEHGGGSGMIELRHEGDLLDCDICDEGPGLPPGADGTHLAAPTDERGRGLHLAHMLCDQVVHHRVVTGTRITLTIAITAAA
ncbi:ATP-binding protein [Dactylosporangium sp. NBC_01737]|uniref:ATP-binding protein n=1 Tax=Dactylosporangium sp. NBC_01737 TaxID=2975959 RepID=UPI002E10279B|nr:ATP-binding protein [Dactylosporangium sp. NBC_01737]